MRTAYDIKYDTDGDKGLAESLPKEIDIPDGIKDDDIADYISDQTGFCIFGCQVRGTASPRLSPLSVHIAWDGNFISVQNQDDPEPSMFAASPGEAYNKMLELFRDELDAKADG